MAEMLTLRLDMNNIAIGDIEDFEEYTGETIAIIDEIGTDRTVSAKVYTGLALLALRQQNPDATVADARKVRIGELMRAASELVQVASDPTLAVADELQPLREKATRPVKRTAG